LHRKRRDRHTRREKVVEFLEQIAEYAPDSSARLLGNPQLQGRGAQPGPDIARDILAEPFQLIQPWIHLRHEPQAAQSQERLASEGEVERDLFHGSADLLEPSRRTGAHLL